MTKQEFRRKVKAVFPEAKEFDHTEVQNAAYLKGYCFYNNVHSDAVHIQFGSKYNGRAYAIEDAN